MKKFLQLPFLLVATLLSSIPISAHDFEVDGIYYKILKTQMFADDIPADEFLSQE